MKRMEARPLEKAAKKARKHAQFAIDAVLREKPGKQIHEVPFKEVAQIASRALSKHEDFVLRPSNDNRTPYLVLKQLGEKKPAPYAIHELGHQIIRARVISQLKAEDLLEPQHEKTVEQALGELDYNPPAREYRARIKAVKKLQRGLGKTKTNELLARAGEIWEQHQSGGVFPEPNYLMHAFTNPGINFPLSFIYRSTTRGAKKPNPTEQFKKQLEEHIKYLDEKK